MAQNERLYESEWWSCVVRQLAIRYQKVSESKPKWLTFMLLFFSLHFLHFMCVYLVRLINWLFVYGHFGHFSHFYFLK